MKQPAFTPFGPQPAAVAADADEAPGEPLLEGNQADLLESTEDVRAALIGAMRRARDHVNLDAALLHAPGLGAELIECLGERCREGVRVQVIAHTLDMARAAGELGRLCEAGVTLNEVRDRRGWRGWVDRRRGATLRQLAVVDGEVAWCGPGIRSADGCSFGPHVCVRGPVVQRLQRLFLEAWHASSTAVRLPEANYFPALAPAGPLPMGVALSPIAGGTPLRPGHSLVGQVDAASERVLLSMVQRAPSRRLTKALVAALGRGVAVTVLVDKRVQTWGWPDRGSGLLRAGASVYRADDTCPFPCHAVVDGQWSSLALDELSAKVGEGAELVVVDAEFARSLARVFHQASGNAVRLLDVAMAT
jgi:cardiolipin synthase